ncbi:MAG: hypothetical protein J6Y64_09125 [Ruminococcus sp.]|nr:hypothetical protein [Ruminococcus sp.]
MKLTDYITGHKLDISVQVITEMHSRGPWTEIKTGVNIDGIVVTSKYTVRESVPQIMELIRKEKTS